MGRFGNIIDKSVSEIPGMEYSPDGIIFYLNGKRIATQRIEQNEHIQFRQYGNGLGKLSGTTVGIVSHEYYIIVDGNLRFVGISYCMVREVAVSRLPVAVIPVK